MNLRRISHDPDRGALSSATARAASGPSRWRTCWQRDGQAATRTDPLAPKQPHFAPKAKNVIFLFMEGAPSQIDLFDPKPELQKWHGKPLPESMTKDLKLAFIKPTAAVLASPRKFKPLRPVRHGVLRLHPEHRLVRRRYLPGALDVHRGLQSSSGPVAADDRNDADRPADAGRMGRLRPGQRIARICRLRGAQLRRGHQRRRIEFLERISAVHLSGRACSAARAIRFCICRIRRLSPKDRQRAALDALRDLNQEHLAETGDVEIASRIDSYELAFRMQMAAPELLDFSKESPGDARDVRRRTRSRPGRSRPTVCWRAAWWSAACAS